MTRYTCFIFVAAALIVGLVVPNAVFAHERRQVGPYEFVVGFMNEPAFENEQNGIWLKITDTATGQPVENAAGTLQAEVIKGASQRTLELTPAFGEKGVYTSIFYPTEAGDYTFRFTGEIDGTPVDEQFTSSPDGFHGVEPAAELQFPNQLPAASDVNAQIMTAQATARTALVLGGIGLGVGVISLGIAGLLALRGRRAATTVHGSSVVRS